MDYSEKPDVKTVLSGLSDLVKSGKLTTYVPLLSGVFNLRGKPFSLVNHYLFEPLFSSYIPKAITLRTGRQVGKTLSVAARALFLSGVIPYFRVLFVTPLLDQAQRLSNDNVKPLIEESPMRAVMFNEGRTAGSVMRREFKNHSAIYFSYALLSAERVRSYSGICLTGLDEVQNLNPAFIPIIGETMSGREEYEMWQYTGTSKTKDGPLEWLWQSSSQAEWITKCYSCSFYNIAAAESNGGHLEMMLGPYREDISEDSPGIVCARCQKPLRPRTGRWIHRFPQRARDNSGYHIPQPIMPIHYHNAEKWRKLLSKQKGAGNYTTAKFYNECLGEAYDVATKLVNQPDLEKAGCLNVNNESIAQSLIGKYIHRVMGVDWGGGGEEGVSLTAIAVLGMLPDGKIDVIYGKKLLTPHDHNGEANEVKRLYNVFQCERIAHDYTGAGELRETVMVHSGMHSGALMPISYIGAGSGNILNYKPSTVHHPREYWTADKSRSLQVTCYAIKFGQVRFFRYDFISPEDPGLLHDFLALVENKIETARGSDVYTIQRNPNMPDDFAHAVNVGCCCLWHVTGAWPNFASLEHAGATEARLKILADEINQSYFDT